MKSLFLSALLIVTSCSAYTAELKSWEFVQSVGGIAIYEPYQEQGIYYLPIKVDVSGLQEITHKPTMLNSALMCSRTGHLIVGNEVHVSIYTSVIDKTASNNCKSIPMLNIKEGKYSVYYNTEIDGKHLLGEITIGSNKSLNQTGANNAPPG